MAMTLDGTNGAFLPTWTTATRPASPANGLIGYNSTTGQLDQYVGSAWASVPTGSASAATATTLGTVYGKTDSVSIVALGYQALSSNTATENTAVGFQAGQVNTSGGVTAFGKSALSTNTTGADNTALGKQALASNSTGSSLTAVGYQSLYSNATGNNSTAIGYYALRTSTGSSNVAVGYNALTALTTTNHNVAVGNSAGYATTTGYENVFVGGGAGLLNTTGYFNICIGRSAGENTGPTTGASNTLIGNDARCSSANGNTQLVVASRQSRTGIGDNTGLIDGGTGGIYQGNNSSSWSTTSDRRLKKNIVDNTQGLDIVSQVRVRNFEYKTVEEVTELGELPSFTAIEKTGVQLGVIAQELEEVCSDCVTTVSTGVKTVDSDNLFWHMINAIKDLKAELDTVKAELATLKG